MNPPFSAALVEAVIADPAALDQLAAALAPRLAVVAPATTGVALSTAQAAQRAGLHERSIRRALAARTLPGRVIAGRWRVDPDDVDAWLAIGAPTSTTPTHANGRRRHGGATAGTAAIAGLSERAA